MKKKLSFAILLLLLLSFCACGNQQKNKGETIVGKMVEPSFWAEANSIIGSFLSFDSDVDGFSFTRTIADYDFRDLEKYEHCEFPSTVEIDIDGVHYSCSYRNMSYQICNDYPTFEYRSSGVVIGFDPDGNLSFIFRTKANLGSESTSLLSLESCQAKAELFFTTYVPYVHAEDYVVSVSEISDSRYEIGAFEFTFTKKIEGVETMDYATITVLKDGQIASFVTSMLGRVNLSRNPFDMDAVKEAIEKKFRLAFDGRESLFKSAEYKINCLILTVLKDGTPALYASIEPTLKEKEGWEYSDLGIFFIRYVEAANESIVDNGETVPN